MYLRKFRLSIKSKISNYYLFRFTSNLYFDRSNFLFFLTSVGLNAAQIGALQSVYFWVNLITEVPTGVVADKVSKKFSVALGCFLMSVVFFLFPLINSFYLFIFVLSIFAIAVSLRSGAENSLIYEELLIAGEKWEKKSKKVFTIGNSLSLFAVGAASLIGSYLMTKSWKHVYWTLSFIMFLSGLISLNFNETINKKLRSDKKHESVTKSLFKFIKTDKNYSYLFFSSGVALLFSIQNPVFVFSQTLFKFMGFESYQASLALALIFVASAIINIFISKYSFWETRTFFYSLFILTSLIYYFLPFTKSVYLSILIVGFSSVIQSLVLVYMEHYLNRVVDSKIRASFLSVNFFIISLFSAISMPIYGAFVDKFNPQMVFEYIWFVPLIGLAVITLSIEKE